MQDGKAGIEGLMALEVGDRYLGIVAACDFVVVRGSCVELRMAPPPPPHTSFYNDALF